MISFLLKARFRKTEEEGERRQRETHILESGARSGS
jgi:hypothetical protein